MKYLFGVLACGALWIGCQMAKGADETGTWDALDIPSDHRKWFLNFTNPGSCVQCSIGMCGVDQNVPEASTLLWDTDYGKKEWHGSYPGRVENYAAKRGMRIYNVTGTTTWEWMKWSCETGRGCAIGAGGFHFQTLVGYNRATNEWRVCNNNSPEKITTYSDDAFRRLHLASGQWVVILDYPPHPAIPKYRTWWKA
jgi:hypothetical protein